MWPPAVGILNRVTKVETAIGPYTIPAGMNVGTNIIGLMHNSKYYPNPEKFDPERWNDNKLLSTEPYAFVPFSAGPRSCIGKYLALMESKQILVRFLYNF
jgi:cytochrome P450